MFSPTFKCIFEALEIAFFPCWPYSRIIFCSEMSGFKFAELNFSHTHTKKELVSTVPVPKVINLSRLSSIGPYRIVKSPAQ